MVMAAQSPPLRQLQKLDTDFSYFLHSIFHSYLPSSLHLLLELSADFRFSFPVTLSLCLSPLPASLLPFFSSLIFGLLLDLALVGLIKVIFRRRRPPYNPNMSAVVSADNFSFPSGHSSRVFFVAALVSMSEDAILAALVELRASGGFVDRWIVWDDLKVVGILVLAIRVWAAVTALSRVLLGRHFFFDVLAGACLGVFEGLVAFRFLRFQKFMRYWNIVSVVAEIMISLELQLLLYIVCLFVGLWDWLRPLMEKKGTGPATKSQWK